VVYCNRAELELIPHLREGELFESLNPQRDWLHNMPSICDSQEMEENDGII
jgi:hypothetical protein